MALAYGATILNGSYTKIFTVTLADNDAAANLTVDFSTSCGSDLLVTPLEARYVITASAADLNALFAVTAMAADACTIRLLANPGGAGGAVTVRFTIRCIHTIDR